MPVVLALLILGAFIMFLRACLVTLGFYKEPILSAFQQYGDEVGFSPLFNSIVWSWILAYLLLLVIVPSSFLVVMGVMLFVISATLYWKIRDSILNHPEVFLRYPRWYRDIVDHTSREERRKLSYMWLGLPLRTRLLYNAHEEAFRKWVELVVLSVA